MGHGVWNSPVPQLTGNGGDEEAVDVVVLGVGVGVGNGNVMIGENDCVTIGDVSGETRVCLLVGAVFVGVALGVAVFVGDPFTPPKISCCEGNGSIGWSAR